MDVGLDEAARVEDGAVDVGLGGEVDYGVHLGHQAVHQLLVADVTLHEAVVGVVLHVGQVRRGFPRR